MRCAGLALAALAMAAMASLEAREPAGRTHVEPRVILGLYDGSVTPPRLSAVHRMAEMPLNHLGFIVRSHDIREPLPAPDAIGDVRGILCWFQNDRLPNPTGLIRWLEQIAASGRRVVWMGNGAVDFDQNGRAVPAADIERFWRLFGLERGRSWTDITYDAKVLQYDAAVFGFERKLTGILPPFGIYRRTDASVRSHLVVERSGKSGVPALQSHLVVTGPSGGFVASGYAFYQGLEHHFQWYVNPFEFFRLAFLDRPLPAPDTTTISGRRIYYSHIDGDGWRNRTEVHPFRSSAALSASVVLHELIEPYADLPLTVAPIAADLDPAWRGSRETLAVARKILALPQVEAGTHTYTHPLKWEFFEKYDRSREPAGAEAGAGERADTPRAYADRPFDLAQEIAGSIAYIERLLPAGKKVRVLQWSGNTLAFETAIAAARRAGVRNINGGDSRFDVEYPSAIWVSPLARRVGGELQIYSSNSNENTYTDLWTGRYFGYRLIQKTLENTEKPRRLKPFNLYYHMYTGEKHASLHAMKQNLALARTSEIAPIETSRFAAIVEGFFSARIISLGERIWRIEDRGELQTLRFDDAAGLWVDFGRSRGVAGERHHQGSLYVALDAAESAPVVALRMGGPDRATALVESRWRVWDVRRTPDGLRFRTQGFGPGEMTWRMSRAGAYTIEANGVVTTVPTREGGTITARIPTSTGKSVDVTVRPAEGGSS
jgi:hypothetical protein